MILGEPDRVRNNERLFLYWWQEQYGGIEGLGGGAPVMRTYSLHVEFDENNVVEKFEIIQKRMLDKFDEDSE